MTFYALRQRVIQEGLLTPKINPIQAFEKLHQTCDKALGILIASSLEGDRETAELAMEAVDICEELIRGYKMIN